MKRPKEESRHWVKSPDFLLPAPLGMKQDSKVQSHIFRRKKRRKDKVMLKETMIIKASATTEKATNQVLPLPSFVTDAEKFRDDVQTAYNVLHIDDLKYLKRTASDEIGSLLGYVSDDYDFAVEASAWDSARVDKLLHSDNDREYKLGIAVRAWFDLNREQEEYKKRVGDKKASLLAVTLISTLKLTSAKLNTPAGLPKVIDAFSPITKAVQDGKNASEADKKNARTAVLEMYNELLTGAGFKPLQKLTATWFADVCDTVYPDIKGSKSTYNQNKGTFSMAGFTREVPAPSKVFGRVMSAFWYHNGIVKAGKKAGRETLNIF